MAFGEGLSFGARDADECGWGFSDRAFLEWTFLPGRSAAAAASAGGRRGLGLVASGGRFSRTLTGEDEDEAALDVDASVIVDLVGADLPEAGEDDRRVDLAVGSTP